MTAPQGELKILPGVLLQQGGEWSSAEVIGLQYLRKRFFKSDQVDAYLDSLVEVEWSEFGS